MFRNIPIAEVDANPEQPREHFDGIEELAQSIAAEGLIEPIMVRPIHDTGRFQIVHGERRFRASKLAGLSEIPALVRNLDDATAYRLSVVENVQRAALTPIEEARSFKRLQELGHTQADIGKIIGKGQSYVAHKLRLLKTPAPLTYYLEVGALTENHLRQALRLKSILGEDMPDDCSNYKAVFEAYEREYAKSGLGLREAADRAAVVLLVRMRPYGRVDMMAPGEVLTGAVRRWVDYVSKHNDALPLWERHAFWALSLMAYLGAGVADATRLIDNLRAYYYSAIGNYLLDHMGADYMRGRWGRYNWAVYHDLKHGGLLTVVNPDELGDSDASLELFERASEYVLTENSLVHPTEAHGPRANKQLLEDIEMRFGPVGSLRSDGE